MSNEIEQATGIVHYWKEIVALMVTILGGIRLLKKKSEGKMLVTRDYLNEKLDDKFDLLNAQIKLSQKSAVDNAVGKVYRKIDNCRSDFSVRMDSCRHEHDSKLDLLVSRVDRLKDKS